MNKKCKNLSCKNNLNGECNKQSYTITKTVFDTLSYSQWEKIREYSKKQALKGVKPLKKCNNIECINNIEKGCYLPSELEALSVIL
ncbi:MAG: hypothetical protein WC393_01650 [Candidatus Nanoarchaeia archaeon]|jgi:hypothetical protein